MPERLHQHLLPWLWRMEPSAKHALWAAFCGCAVCAMAIHVILDMPVIISGVRVPLEIKDKAQDIVSVSAIVSAMLWFSALGGPFFGWLSDHIGRAPTLPIAVALLGLPMSLCCIAWNPTVLLWLHAVMGFGFGGVWTASAVLTGEWANPAHRGKTVGLMQSGWAVGWGVELALKWLLLYLFPEDVAWRWMFGLGLTPLVLAVFTWRFVKEAPEFTPPGPVDTVSLYNRLVHLVKQVAHLGPDLFRTFNALLAWLLDLVLAIFGQELTGSTARQWWWTFVLSTGAQAGYYAVTLSLPGLLPNFLADKVVSADRYSFIIIAGSLVGYLVGAWASDRFGRRSVFVVSALSTIVTAGLCTQAPNTAWAAVLAFPLGIFASGVFSGLNAFLTELFLPPTRGQRQGASYNYGRRAAAYSVLLVGWFESNLQISGGLPILVFVGIAYTLVIVAALRLPPTN
jgi:MFS family permease